MESEDSKHAAGIAYIVGDELLCVQSTSGRWGIPKGHRHVDETPEEGAHREFTEETQIILNRDIELSHIGKKKNGGDFHVFICKGQKKFVPHIGHEHMAWGYYNTMNLPQPFDDRVLPILDNLYEASHTSDIKGLKGATGFIKPEEWEAKKKSLKKSVEKTTGYLLLERIDYNHIAKTIVKQYGLKSKIKMGSGKDFGEYIPETDTITLRPSYRSVKEFLMNVLHEIGHALDAKRLGVKKYIKKYTQAGTMANYRGLHPHDDNKWEEKAEKFAHKELHKWL